MAFKFYIDDQLVDQPINDKALTTTIRRDDNLNAILITQDAQLEWAANNAPASGEISAYTYLKGLFDTSLCDEAELEIYDEVNDSTTYLTYKGIIKMPSIEFDEHRMILKTKVQDNSYYAYVNNNRELKVNLNANRTKNTQQLTEIDTYSLDLFRSSDGAYGSGIGAYFHGYLLQDVLAFIVAAVSDGLIAFQSDYLDNLDPQIFISKGQDLLNPYTIFPSAQAPLYEISFSEAFTELDKMKNVSFYIDATDPENPVMRLEETETTYTGTVTATLSDIKELRTYVNTSKMYGSVRVGSDTVATGSDPAIFTYNEQQNFYTWRIENFFPTGQCNTSEVLDLVNRWVLSNNTNQDVIIGQSDTYIDNIFVIECNNVDEGFLTADAYRYDYFGQTTPPYFYNLGVNNYTKLQRHANKFQTLFGSFLAVGNGGFRALLGDDPTFNVVYNATQASQPNFVPPGGLGVIPEYVNESSDGGYDGGGNYDNVTFQYVVPVDGNYTFRQHLEMVVAGIQGTENFEVTSYLYLYDSTVTIQKDTSVYFINWSSNGYRILDHTAFFNAVAGDVVLAQFRIRYDATQPPNPTAWRTITQVWKSFFECNGTPDGSLAVASGNQDIRNLIHEFEYFIDETTWRSITANPTGLIAFEKDGTTRYGWIQEAKHDNWTGRTQLKLTTSNASSS